MRGEPFPYFWKQVASTKHKAHVWRIQLKFSRMIPLSMKLHPTKFEQEMQQKATVAAGCACSKLRLWAPRNDRKTHSLTIGHLAFDPLVVAVLGAQKWPALGVKQRTKTDQNFQHLTAVDTFEHRNLLHAKAPTLYAGM